MDRRKFLRALAGGTAAAVAVRSWPFRVFSFPTTLPKSMFLHLRGSIGEAPVFHAHDFIVGYDFFAPGPGQLVAAYDSSGRLNRGVFRIVSVDRVRREMEVEYIAHDKMPAPGEYLGLSRAKYPGPLEKFPDTIEVRKDLVGRVMSTFKSHLNELTEGIEQQDLLLRDIAPPSWKRTLLRA